MCVSARGFGRERGKNLFSPRFDEYFNAGVLDKTSETRGNKDFFHTLVKGRRRAVDYRREN